MKLTVEREPAALVVDRLRQSARSWPEEILRAAHAAHTRGERLPHVDAGEREYQRRRTARRRNAAQPNSGGHL